MIMILVSHAPRMFDIDLFSGGVILMRWYCVCVFIKWLVGYSVKGESLLNCACVFIKWLMGYSVRGESLFKVFQAGRDLIQEVNCWKDRREHNSGNPEAQESRGLTWEMLVCMSPGNWWFPKLKKMLPSLLCRYLAPTCTVLSSIKASPSPPSNLTKELLLPSHHSPLHKLHLMGRSLLWSSNHSSSSRTEISGQLTSWSLQPPISVWYGLNSTWSQQRSCWDKV